MAHRCKNPLGVSLIVLVLTLPLWLVGCQSGASAYQEYLQDRIDVAKENISNANTIADHTGHNNPYRRKIVHWDTVSETWSIEQDLSPFKCRYEPFHHLADDAGYVRYPNVDLILENLELDEAEHALREYQANTN